MLQRVEGQDEPVRALIEVEALRGDQLAIHQQVDDGRRSGGRVELSGDGEALAFAELARRIQLANEHLWTTRGAERYGHELHVGSRG